MPDSLQRKVEKVVGMRTLNGIREYMIKWKGVPESRNTWETEASCNCQDEIRKFLASFSTITLQDEPSRAFPSTGSRNLESSPGDSSKKRRISRNLSEKQTSSPKPQAGTSVSKGDENERLRNPEVVSIIYQA